MPGQNATPGTSRSSRGGRIAARCHGDVNGASYVVGVEDLEGDGVVWVEQGEPVRGEGADGGGVGRFDPSEGVLVSYGP